MSFKFVILYLPNNIFIFKNYCKEYKLLLVKILNKDFLIFLVFFKFVRKNFNLIIQVYSVQLTWVDNTIHIPAARNLLITHFNKDFKTKPFSNLNT